MRVVIAFAAGLIFGLGLIISQMVNPDKVRSFLDFFGDWDPSLMFVLAAAVLVSIIAWKIRQSRAKPVFGSEFPGKPSLKIDRDLILGAVLFGIGWGLVGLCPGPAVTGLLMHNSSVWLFTIAMIAGFAIYNFSKK